MGRPRTVTFNADEQLAQAPTGPQARDIESLKKSYNDSLVAMKNNYDKVISGLNKKLYVALHGDDRFMPVPVLPSTSGWIMFPNSYRTTRSDGTVVINHGLRLVQPLKLVITNLYWSPKHLRLITPAEVNCWIHVSIRFEDDKFVVWNIALKHGMGENSHSVRIPHVGGGVCLGAAEGRIIGVSFTPAGAAGALAGVVGKVADTMSEINMSDILSRGPYEPSLSFLNDFIGWHEGTRFSWAEFKGVGKYLKVVEDDRENVEEWHVRGKKNGRRGKSSKG